ncbi:MAG TPA: AAA family ATPase [Rubrobacteraceae bacterium]|nr:AAA family ATPase [Rubrobacteraceae bacterium]
MGSPTLRIRLLGELDLRYDGAPLPPLESARAASLLAYLLLHREAPQPRQRLALLLWPDSTESQARTNLRHVLHNLRRALPDPDRFLDVTPRTLQWRADAPFWLDVAAFEDAVAQEKGNADSLTALRKAAELYTGDLLEGSYDEWLLEEREWLRQRYVETLQRLATLLEERRDHARAIPYAERLLRQDPLREETYRLLMRLHDARGDRARALRVYHVCAATLERELAVEPSAPTREAYEALLPLELEPAERQIGGPPLIGRAPERARLSTLWRAAESGQAGMVLVTGEPGVGKTRLVEEFRSWCAHRGAVTAEARSYPAEGVLAYGPVVAWLRSEAFESRLERLDRARLTELSRLLPELLSKVPGLARPEPLSEEDQRQRLFDAAARTIFAAGAPLLLVADDLHWCDRETLQFLHYLLRAAPRARLLVVATARREEVDGRHPLNDLLAGLQAMERLTEIEVGRLTREETAVLAERLAGYPLEEPDRLYAETEGNPLFVVEALRAGWKGGSTERGWISPKVQAVISSRLAQVSEPARDLAGVAATIGREFTSDVLAQASGVDEETLVSGLDELWRRRIVREQGADAYDFSHDKIREVAYLALSPARRRQLHLRVARALERAHAHDPGPVTGQLAVHYERAGATEEAITWYVRAAEVAQQLHANVEVGRILDSALDLLHTLPETPERDTRELSILSALQTSLGWVEGWASERLAAVQNHALDLAATLGVEPAPPLLRSMAITSLARRDFAAARGFGGRLYARGVRDADGMLLVEADYVLGIAAFWQGELDAARKHFQAAVDRYRPDQHHAHLLRYGLDPNVICLSRLGNTLWFLGYPEAATRARDEALALAEEIGHPFSREVALVFASVLALDMRDPDRIREYAAMLAAERREAEARVTRAASEAFGGYVDVLDGREEAGITRIQRSLDDTRTGDYAPGGRAVHVRILLEACAVSGDARTGLAVADRALTWGDADRLWEVETRRLRAEFLAALGSPVQDIEAELERALAVARRQGARMLELRTVASLLRHRMERGDGPGAREARALLAGIFDTLPEGRDTRDLREAATILAQTRDAARPAQELP